MIIKAKTKGFICVNAHPKGCHNSVEEQIAYAKQAKFDGPKKVLVIGCSSGYGLASRIAFSFAAKTDSLGVYFDREPTARKTASAGWYNNEHLEKLAIKEGLIAESLNIDAFQNEAKLAVIERIRQRFKEVDMVVYSVAAPRRYVADENKWYNSVLKPVGKGFKGKTINTDKGEIVDVAIDSATEEEVESTIKVMGGEDWYQWMAALNDAGVLSADCKTIAYTYIGEQLTQPIYGEATIGFAKKDLDETAVKIEGLLSRNRQESHQTSSGIDGKRAYIGVLKAIVTQSSAAIPVMPLYISLLYKVMKEKGVHEGCIEQVTRMLSTGVYGLACKKDAQGRLRVDEHELDEQIQREVTRRWALINNENLRQLSDFDGYKNDFLRLFGFGFTEIDYDQDTETMFKEKVQTIADTKLLEDG
jgi:enoyl-[acyl-carrier protein] reductase/trans-2-enoyl-CoA reductase (NAD+)